MKRYTVFDVGNEILREITKAVETNDYSNLNTRISSKINTAVKIGLSEAERSYRQKQANARQNGSSATSQKPRQATNVTHYASERRNSSRTPQPAPSSPANGSSRKSSQVLQTVAAGATPFLQTSARRGAGNKRLIGGIVAAACGGTLFLYNLVSMIVRLAIHVSAGGPIFGMIVFGLLAAYGTWLIVSGSRTNRLIEKYLRYGRILGKAEYFTLKDYAGVFGTTYEKLKADIQQMINRGMLPHAIMDNKETTLLLTDGAISQYREFELGRQQQEEERRRQEEMAAAEMQKPGSLSAEARSILTEGNAYIKRVREVNDEIPDDLPMSAKLYRLEDIMNQIFRRLKAHPENAKNLRKFMDYYLPTTTRLLEAYLELDKQEAQSENISGPMREIEATMDTITDGFTKLLDSMYQDMAWDVSSDISVMKTMMKQDGLTESDLYQTIPVPEEKVPEPVKAK